MKIMQVIPYIKNESAGTTHVIIALCQALVRNGCDIVLYTLDPVPKKNYGFEIRSFKPSFFPHKALGRSKKMLHSMQKNAHEFDLIHNHVLWMAPNYYAGKVAEHTSTPFICSPHGSLSVWALARSSWKKKISMLLGQKEALNYASCFHVTAQHEVEEIRQVGYSTPCSVIPNGVDIPSNINLLHKEYKQILFLSRIHPVKGLDNLLYAWKELEVLYPSWELVIVGPNSDQDYANKINNIVNDNNLKRVRFKGEVTGDKKYEYMTAADLFVLPTHSENFAMVVAEALACKTPVICTKGAPWEKLKTYNAGWWIDIGIQPLINTLKEAMSLDPVQRTEMGLNGHNWMAKEYSWDTIALDMIETYRWLINNEKAPLPTSITGDTNEYK